MTCERRRMSARDRRLPHRPAPPLQLQAAARGSLPFPRRKAAGSLRTPAPPLRLVPRQPAPAGQPLPGTCLQPSRCP
ncbi:hypothetical protein GQ55_5G394400 [Panicum hallii var. hallii]|uniref:Uncharacterized protein n=1 Tax=Panicum hallii var. hallii TaxID=1504633 RepID=A0A2T7DN47_9POAL|nr:hypothetical protein GQ55_5G394400 [Panicum hallii var. hallii]